MAVLLGSAAAFAAGPGLAQAPAGFYGGISLQEPGERGGIEFEQDIENMFYGARQFGIRDLNGYILYFIQSIGE